MRRLRFKKSKKRQENPYEYIGEHNVVPVQMQLFVYNRERYIELQDVGLEEVAKELAAASPDDVKWLNIHGLHNEQLIREVGELIGLDTYIIADILNTARRSRIEELDEILFFSIKSILQEGETESARVEQISFLIKENLLV
ncbi:MAG TPA: CorA family divalent cation transporter, partial [Flavobacterium sp.]|nr:CorA family divalent cation transporter [Flavobacterium sp.]